MEFRAHNEPQLEQEDASEEEDAPGQEDKRKSPQKRRRGLSTQPQPKDKRRRTSPSQDFIAQHMVETALISQMAKSICSAAAIKQFFRIVRGRRLLELTALRMIKGDDHSHIHKNAAQMVRSLSDKNDFIKFAVRLSQRRFAQHSNLKKNGRERIRRGLVQKISKEVGIGLRQYRCHQENGQKWEEYCKRFPGILCFILFQTQPFGFSSADWVRLKGTQFDSLQRDLRDQFDAEYLSALCSAGKIFEDSVVLEADDVEFIGETLSLDIVPEGDLISCLRPVETTDELIYHKDDYLDWPRPEDWPNNLDWPSDPTYVPPGEKQCDVCDKSKCDCARRRPKILPRIRIYDEVCKPLRKNPARSHTKRVIILAKSPANWRLPARITTDGV